MPNDPRRVRQKLLRMRSGNHLWCLLCYLAAFAVPVLWQAAAIRLIYPFKLYGTAPDIAAHLINAFPFLAEPLSPVASFTAENVELLRQTIAARDQVWLAALVLCAAAAWGITLLIQLVWRFSHCSPISSARTVQRAIRSYRIMMLFVWLINAAIAAGVWLFGVQFIAGRTAWDYIVSFGVFLLIPLSAALVSRLAASPVISGKHAFFKRISL